MAPEALPKSIHVMAARVWQPRPFYCNWLEIVCMSYNGQQKNFPSKEHRTTLPYDTLATQLDMSSYLILG
jgi:hypothetical protein